MMNSLRGDGGDYGFGFQCRMSKLRITKVILAHVTEGMLTAVRDHSMWIGLSPVPHYVALSSLSPLSLRLCAGLFMRS